VQNTCKAYEQVVKDQTEFLKLHAVSFTSSRCASVHLFINGDGIPTLLQNCNWLLFIDTNGENTRDSSGERHQRVKIYSSIELSTIRT
jgi:hypothetical protein